jgi:hypothetical protein
MFNQLKTKIMKTTTEKEVVEVIFVEINDDKLSRQLLSLVDSSKGNNYEETDIRVVIYSDGSIRVESFYTNEYGSRWYNDNETEVSRENIPFFTAKKLGLM